MSWYNASKNGKKRRITIASKDGYFDWCSENKIDDSYNIVSIKTASTIHNFYIWSSKTVESAKTLYASKDYDKSLKMLKKYSFDINSVDEDEKIDE
jgi:hypothetical protein